MLDIHAWPEIYWSSVRQTKNKNCGYFKVLRWIGFDSFETAFQPERLLVVCRDCLPFSDREGAIEQR